VQSIYGIDENTAQQVVGTANPTYSATSIVGGEFLTACSQ
jgi:hypothetical protein